MIKIGSNAIIVTDEMGTVFFHFLIFKSFPKDKNF